MQKVRSNFYIIRATYKITISCYSLTVLFAVAHMLYLVFEEGSPEFSNNSITILLIIQTDLLIFTIFVESLLISFPKATKIFQFALFII
jgi:hypothetical protein